MVISVLIKFIKCEEFSFRILNDNHSRLQNNGQAR